MTENEILILCILIGMSGIQLPTFLFMRHLRIKQLEILNLLHILHSIKQMNEEFDAVKLSTPTTKDAA